MAVKAKAQTTVVNVNDGYAGVNWIKNSAYELIVTKDTTLPQNQPYIYIQINAESDIFDLQTIVNKTCTFSLYVYSPGESVIVDPDEPDVVKTRFGAHMITYWLDSDGNQKSTYPFSKLVTYSEKNKGRISSAQEISPPDSTHTILKKMTVAIQAGLKPASDNDETWVIAYPKFEIGDTATEWSPCPTDSISVEKRVTSAETSIKNNTTQINLRATKTEVATAKSEAISTAASDATTKADNAKSEAISTAASDATTKANNAKTAAISTAASDATTKANNAKSEAIAESKTYTDAQIKVESDSITSTVEKTYATKLALDSTDKTVSSHTSSISTLQQTAEGFEARITSNKTAAAKAQTTADSASTSAAAAQTAATNAQTAATTAQSTADTAKSNAATAQTTADDAKSAAAAAQSTADTAKTNAATAQTTAEAAKSTADSASASAATAQTAAEGAQSTADTAVTNAATAQSTANTARTEASDAAKTATNYLKFSEDTGLLVGDMTTDTVGYNTQILSDRINLRSGETILGSFRLANTQSIITLGQTTKQRMVLNSAGATIYDANNKRRAKFGAVTKIGNPSEYNIDIGTAGMIVYNGTTEKARYSDTIQMRNGDAVLAEFTSDTIYLGKNSSTSMIDFCNDQASMYVDDINGFFVFDSSNYITSVESPIGARLYSMVTNEGLAYVSALGGSDSRVIILSSTTDLKKGSGMHIRQDSIYMVINNNSWKPYYTAGDSITTANMRLNGFITNSGSQLYFSIPLSKPMVGVTKATITNHASKSLIIRQAGDYVWGSDGSTWINPTSWSVSLEEGMINVTATSSSKTYKNNYPAAILFRGTITFS